MTTKENPFPLGQPGFVSHPIDRAAHIRTDADKLNIAALGNVVPQLHVHIIARRTSDAAWPRPVWGVVPPISHDPQEIERFIAALRSKIWLS